MKQKRRTQKAPVKQRDLALVLSVLNRFDAWARRHGVARASGGYAFLRQRREELAFHLAVRPSSVADSIQAWEQDSLWLSPSTRPPSMSQAATLRDHIEEVSKKPVSWGQIDPQSHRAGWVKATIPTRCVGGSESVEVSAEDRAISHKVNNVWAPVDRASENLQAAGVTLSLCPVCGIGYAVRQRNQKACDECMKKLTPQQRWYRARARTRVRKVLSDGFPANPLLTRPTEQGEKPQENS